MFGMFSGQGGWQLWESEGYELIISQDFLSDVRYVQRLEAPKDAVLNADFIFINIG